MTCAVSSPTRGTEAGTASEAEYQALLQKCSALPPAQGDYRISDFVENLLLTVVDFQMHTTAVGRAMHHFATHAKSDVRDIADLKGFLSQHTDDQVGNTELARQLWGYSLWTRAAILRRLVEFFEERGVVDQRSLEEWAVHADFARDFQGNVKGLGFAVFHWLAIRQGVESIKPDVHVLRFVGAAIGRPAKDWEAVQLLVRVARDLSVPVHKLDWAIWEAGRGGPVA